MDFLIQLIRGLVCSLTLSSPPLYRYPYRNPLEAFRSDWKRIGGDIDSSLKSFQTQGEHR